MMEGGQWKDERTEGKTDIGMEKMLADVVKLSIIKSG